MGWGRAAPLRCELNLLGSSYGAGWVNKESSRPDPPPLMGWGRAAPLRCELNLLDRPCGTGWVNKEIAVGLIRPQRGKFYDLN